MNQVNVKTSPTLLRRESTYTQFCEANATATRSIDSLTLSTKISSTGGGLPRRGDAGLLKDTVGAESEQSDSVPVVLIAENLMLQRIVQAIREDELDNLWQVTGRVTEYFGENRLTILTAQRGQAKQLPPATDR